MRKITTAFTMVRFPSLPAAGTTNKPAQHTPPHPAASASTAPAQKATTDSGRTVIARRKGYDKNGETIKDSKNISDGAAKGQAVDGMVQNSGGGSGNGKSGHTSAYDNKNVADGAAKGQASEGAAPDPGKSTTSGTSASGKSSRKAGSPK